VRCLAKGRTTQNRQPQPERVKHAAWCHSASLAEAIAAPQVGLAVPAPLVAVLARSQFFACSSQPKIGVLQEFLRVDGQCAMSGSAEASPRSSPPDYHSLYVQARASHERTVYELRQRELELTGELNSKWCTCRNSLKCCFRPTAKKHAWPEPCTHS
jgi:hypothetical protein